MECLGIRGALPSGRTECVPPRKPPFALSQGFPRKAIRARITNPAEGRAPHARKGGHDANPNVAFFCHHALANEPVTVTCLGLVPALPRGRGDRAPPRKPPQRHLRAFHRKAILPWTASPRRGGLRTPGRKGTGLTRGISPLGHRPVACLPVIMIYLGLAYGRYSRARRPRPSEKIAFCVIPGLSSIGLFPRLAPPRRGGLRTPVGNASAQPGACPHLATRYSFAPDDHVMPRLVSGLATRTRRPRPSEKTTPDVISGLFPQGHPSSDHQSGGGAGSARPQGRLALDRGMCPVG
jgi:hypothetical protein